MPETDDPQVLESLGDDDDSSHPNVNTSALVLGCGTLPVLKQEGIDLSHDV